MEPSSDLFSNNKNLLIILLVVLLVISALGVNWLNTGFRWLTSLVELVVTFTSRIVGTFLYSTGEIVNVSSNSVADASKFTIDLGNGAVNDIGNLLKNVGKSNEQQSDTRLDIKLNTPPAPSPSRIPEDPKPTPAIATSSKQTWCLVGDTAGARSCVKIDPAKDQCVSGKTFASQEECR